MKVLLANPRGFCAGVDRAIEIVERALSLFEPPIYVRHEVVHNRCVVEELRKKGAIFVEELDSIPKGSIVIFSAHGVSRHVKEEACRRRLRVIDATCPLVTKVHLEVLKNHQEGYETILIGHRGHPEVDGTMGQYNTSSDKVIFLVESPQDARLIHIRNPNKVAVVTQTTLSLDDTAEIIEILVKRFPNIRKPRKNDICYATQNRQNTVKELVNICDLILIVGSKNSSNSNRLHEIALKRGVDSYLIDTPEEISPHWLIDKQCIGLSAGASAPEALVKRVVQALQNYGVTEVVERPGIEEKITFRLPKELWDFAPAATQR